MGIEPRRVETFTDEELSFVEHNPETSDGVRGMAAAEWRSEKQRQQDSRDAAARTPTGEKKCLIRIAIDDTSISIGLSRQANYDLSSTRLFADLWQTSHV